MRRLIATGRRTVAATTFPAELEPVVPARRACRRAALAALALASGASRPRPAVVVISGPPGIGKTRLSAELATLAQADRRARSDTCPAARWRRADCAGRHRLPGPALRRDRRPRRRPGALASRRSPTLTRGRVRRRRCSCSSSTGEAAAQSVLAVMIERLAPARAAPAPSAHCRRTRSAPSPPSTREPRPTRRRSAS